MNVVASRLVAWPACFVGGYVLNAISIAINQFAAKKLGLPIDVQKGMNYEDYSSLQIENEKKIANFLNNNVERQMGLTLWNYFTQFAIREEISSATFYKKLFSLALAQYLLLPFLHVLLLPGYTLLLHI